MFFRLLLEIQRNSSTIFLFLRPLCILAPYYDRCWYPFDKFRAPRRAVAVPSHRATSWRAFSRLVEEKKEENCSLPLMTPSNNISEVRRGPYLPLPRRPTWKGRPNSGMSSARCGLRPQNLYSLTARAACVHTRRRWRPVWNTARVLLRGESLYRSLRHYSPCLSRFRSHQPRRVRPRG